MLKKPILCLDFDGVINSYLSGWQGADKIPDPPVNGAFDFLEKAKDFFDIQVFSSRSNQDGGINAMMEWFSKWYTEYLFTKRPDLRSRYTVFLCPDWISFPKERPAAFLTIDDRAITFNGTWPDLKDLLDFKPWYKKDA